jgi:hypothetical protein
MALKYLWRFDMASKIERIISTLNNIEVHGKSNLDMLLGCIMTLEQIDAQMKQEAKKKEEETADG